MDTYYQVQQFRIEAANQVRAATDAEEPVGLLSWVSGSMHTLEGAVKAALDSYSDVHVASRWARSQIGVGPILAAGLLAHIDIGKARTAGAIWRFAGLDPTVTWERKTKRPWNARLKVLCWRLGESFVKHSGREGCVYGQLYVQQKAKLVERNQQGAFAERAAGILAAKKFRADTIAKARYSEGRFPDAHVHAMAKRWAVKLFLAHYHHVAYEAAYGEPPPKPYVISVLGHGDYLAPPNWPMR